MNHAVIFGAGAVGRGFIGPLFNSAGWEITFLDVADELIHRLRTDGEYQQIVVDNNGMRRNRIAPVDAANALDHAAVALAVSSADIAATCVGATNLPLLAPAISRALTERERSGRGPLDFLLCENLHDAPSVLRNALDKVAGGDTRPQAGLAATSIGRMIPSGVRDDSDPTAIVVEPYSMLPFDASALLNPPPDVAGLVPILEHFDAYGDRKLYVHNMGHCMLAYLAQEAGFHYLADAIANLGLRHLVKAAMVEASTAIGHEYGLAGGALLDHVNDLLYRFGNRELRDTAERVGQDPVRKMQPEDRLLGAHRLCRRAGVAPLNVSLGVALGAHMLETRAGWARVEVDAHLEDSLFDGTLPDDERWRGLLADQRLQLRAGLDVAAQLQRIEAEYRDSSVV